MPPHPLDDPALLRGLGTASRTLLASVGVTCAADLRRLGAVETWRRVKAAHPKRVSLNLLWALEGALSDRDWRVVAREDRLRLLLELAATDPQVADQSRCAPTV
jgi:DNA transformation protein